MNQVLTIDQYNKSYAWLQYQNINDYCDLITALSDDLSNVFEQIKTCKLEKRSRVFSNSDTESRLHHEIALPIEIQLDGSLRQFRSWILDIDRSLVDRLYYDIDFGNAAAKDTSANRLLLKFAAARKMLSKFQSRHSLTIRRSYFYEDNTLHIENSPDLPFIQGSTRDHILQTLFTDPSSILRNYDLLEAISDITGDIRDGENTESNLKKLSDACKGINDRISSNVKGHVKLIKHEGGFTRLNPSAFKRRDLYQVVNIENNR